VSYRWRRAAAMSGRRCSSACTFFFNREAQPLDARHSVLSAALVGSCSRNSANVVSGRGLIRTTKRCLVVAEGVVAEFLLFAGRNLPGRAPTLLKPVAHARLTLYFAATSFDDSPHLRHATPGAQIHGVRGHGTLPLKKYHGRVLRTSRKLNLNSATALRYRNYGPTTAVAARLWMLAALACRRHAAGTPPRLRADVRPCGVTAARPSCRVGARTSNLCRADTAGRSRPLARLGNSGPIWDHSRPTPRETGE
jgi:hypothetical protein